MKRRGASSGRDSVNSYVYRLRLLLSEHKQDGFIPARALHCTAALRRCDASADLLRLLTLYDLPTYTAHRSRSVLCQAADHVGHPVHGHRFHRQRREARLVPAPSSDELPIQFHHRHLRCCGCIHLQYLLAHQVLPGQCPHWCCVLHPGLHRRYLIRHDMVSHPSSIANQASLQGHHACLTMLDRLIGLYAATAGTVYVGAKILATNVRIADEPNRRARERIY